MALAKMILLAVIALGLSAVQVQGEVPSVDCDVCNELNDVQSQLANLRQSIIQLTGLLKGAPEDCSGVLANGHATSGVYTVYPSVGDPIDVYCDMETDGGGWTVFQRREDGSVDFYRDWESYRQGFGDLRGEFWLGNDNLHRLTSQGEYELRVDLEDFENNAVYALYSSFGIGDESSNYRLTATGYSGTAGDSLSGRHNGREFSTKDRDHDGRNFSCAQRYSGAWWYGAPCHSSNLNGLYLGGKTKQFAKGVVWMDWKGHYYSLKLSEMKFRAKQED